MHTYYTCQIYTSTYEEFHTNAAVTKSTDRLCLPTMNDYVKQG